MNAPELKAEFTLLGGDGVANIILDLEKVQYCDSSGLSSILVGNRLCKNANGLLVLTGTQPTVKKLITISQLDSVLNMVPTVSEAIDYLFMASIENDLNETE
jgi:anti-anti-sigma factor